MLELGCDDEPLGRVDPADLCGLARSHEALGAERVVEHCRDAPARLQAEQRGHGADRVRQHDANGFAALRVARDDAAEQQRSHNELVVRERLALDVLDDDVPPAVHAARVEQRAEQGAPIVRRGEHHLGHQVGQQLAGHEAAFAAADLGRNLEPPRRQDRQRDRREPAQPDAAAHARERRVLRAVDAHGQQHRARLVGDEPGAGIDLHQRARHGDSAFGENRRALVLLDVTNQGLQRVRVRGVERKRVDDLQQRLHPPALGDLRVDRKREPIGQEHGQERGVEKRGVVGDDQHALAGLRVVLEAGHAHVVGEAQHVPQQPPTQSHH